MCDVLVLGTQLEAKVARAIATLLARSGLVVDAVELIAWSPERSGGSSATVAVVPKEGDPERARLVKTAAAQIRRHVRTVIVAHDGDRVDLPTGSARAVVRLGSDPSQLRSQLLDALLDTGPFRALAIPGLVAPSGVAAWTSSQVVASCDDSGRVVAIDSVSGVATTLMVGLTEPHGVALDRRTLLIASKGSHCVVAGEMVDGRFRPARQIGLTGAPRLASPHQATQLAGLVVIADTDNHRVLVAKGHVLRGLGRFAPLEVDTTLKNPCGVAILNDMTVVADTFNDRVIFVRRGRMLKSATIELPAPVQVAVAPDKQILITADDGLHIFEVRPGKRVAECEVAKHATGDRKALRNPFGVAVDRSDKLFVADRSRGVLWTCGMADVIGAGGRDAA